ncbi:MAG: hypothetical protein KDC51_11325, partial [Flavobacteriaceae bacterium]|nr:hypothetical protein [Flavobacteriaceae bacterium]
IWSFYKPYALSSLVITIVMGFINPSIGPILVIKAFLTVFLWYVVNATRIKRKLIFYNNFGISSIKLFAMLFLIDSFITIVYLLVFKNFT